MLLCTFKNFEVLFFAFYINKTALEFTLHNMGKTFIS